MFIVTLCKIKDKSSKNQNGGDTDTTESRDNVFNDHSSQNKTHSAKNKHTSSSITNKQGSGSKSATSNTCDSSFARSATLYAKTATSSAGSDDVTNKSSNSDDVTRKMSLLDQVKANNLCSTVTANSPSVLSSCDNSQRSLLDNLNENTDHSNEPKDWKPLLLVIPLRLGLTDINPVYLSSLKVNMGLII